MEEEVDGGMEVLGGVPCNGELSPRQYTSLIRRASSIHYPPAHHPLHTNKNNKQKYNTVRLKTRLQKPKSIPFEMTSSCVPISPPPPPVPPTPPPPPQPSKGPTTSKATPHPRPGKDMAPLKPHNPRERPKHRTQLYVKLSRGSHLSQSDDAAVCVRSKGSRAGTKTTVSLGRPLPTGATVPSPCPPHSVDGFSLIKVVVNGQSTCDEVDSKPSYLSSDPVSFPSSNPMSSLSPLAPLQPLTPPPQTPLTAPQLGVIRERPYYDCGYDTDRDSPPPPPHSMLESGERRESRCIPPSYPTPSPSPSSVWSRYLSWLHRVTKTHR